MNKWHRKLKFVLKLPLSLSNAANFHMRMRIVLLADQFMLHMICSMNHFHLQAVILVRHLIVRVLIERPLLLDVILIVRTSFAATESLPVLSIPESLGERIILNL